MDTNIFSLAFGDNLDAHVPPPPLSNSTLTNLATLSHVQCPEGRECYPRRIFAEESYSGKCQLHLDVGEKVQGPLMNEGNRIPG